MLKKDETNYLVSHIKLKKIKNYKDGEKVGTNYIYLGDKLVHKEDIYAKKNTSKKESILSKIRKWFND